MTDQIIYYKEDEHSFMTLGELEDRIKTMYAEGMSPRDQLVVKMVDVSGLPLYHERMSVYHDDNTGVIEIEG